MNWFMLFIAGLFETAWAIGLKYTDGLTRFWPTIFTLVAIIISMSLLGLSLKYLPVGTAYAVWTGIGAIGTAILGIVLFGESIEPSRIISITFIILGIVGLKLANPT